MKKLFQVLQLLFMKMLHFPALWLIKYKVESYILNEMICKSCYLCEHEILNNFREECVNQLDSAK